MMNLRASIDIGTNISTELMEDVKREAALSGVDLLYTPSKGFSPNDIPPELIIVIFEAMKNVSYCGIYDAIKFFVVHFKSKIENAYGSKVKKITFICDGKKYSINTNLELSQNNIDQIIDSIVKKISGD